jgi:hypothetical protein
LKKEDISEKDLNALIGKLHTAGRRYCLDRYDYWWKRYIEIQTKGHDRKGNHTDEALRVFPRYNILNAILVEVELSLRHKEVDE